jgi:hypothetical protein
MSSFWFHPRAAYNDTPAGTTVSKRKKLPDGDFMITECEWPDLTLWFVDCDKFTADERESARRAYILEAVLTTPESEAAE